MDISLAYPKYCQQWRSRATHYPKYIRYSSANHRNARKAARSRQKQGKLVKSLWFLPIAIIKKLFRLQLSCTSDTEDDLI